MLLEVDGLTILRGLRTSPPKAAAGTPARHRSRTTLEWACDPSNGYRHPAIRSHDQSLVIVCNGGYSSSLDAANLALLGFRAVCDLTGGHQAWVRAGHEVVRPDHTSLDS